MALEQIKTDGTETGATVANKINAGLTAIEAPRDSVELIGANPVVKMLIEAGGHSAQMEVIDYDTMHLVAEMEYIKASQSFGFGLFDKDTGAQKASFEIKPDGNAYIGGKQMAITDYEYVKIPNQITVAGTAWEDALILNTPLKPIGLYELKWEILFTMNTVSRSAKFRYSIDDGANWAVLSKEVKDKTNEETISIWFPYELAAAQEFKLKVQVAKEDAGSVMKCKFGSLVVERKK